MDGQIVTLLYLACTSSSSSSSSTLQQLNAGQAVNLKAGLGKTRQGKPSHGKETVYKYHARVSRLHT